jgi:DNA-directed RNA polymerase specialized sigma24 family protein
MSALGALYDATYDKIYRYVFHRTLDTLETEEIMSDVYMKVFKNLKKFRGTSE